MSAGTLVLGLVNGLLIAFAAVGIVLVYKSNRLVNLANAQLGVLAVQLLGKMVLDWGLNWWVAFALSVPVGVAVGAVIDRVVVRPLRERSASALSLLLVTLGVSQVLLVFTYIPSFGPTADRLFVHGFPEPFSSSISVAGVVLTGADVVALVLVPVVVGALALALRYTMVGRTIRAAASNPDQARLCGVSVRRVSLLTWAVAGGLSAITGILEAPTQSAFSAASLGPELLLLSLGAAAFGAFTSIPMALVGGLVVGMVDQIVLGVTANAGDGELAVLALVIVVVLVRGDAIRRVVATNATATDDRPPVRVPEVLRTTVAASYRAVAVAVAALVALVVPLVPVLRSQSARFDLALIVIYALVAVSLTVAMGWAGQVSLGQFALVGAAAFPAGMLLAHGWSLLFVLVVASIVAAVCMVVVGLPALRVPGLTLAVTTLGLAVVAPDWLFRQSWFGGPTAGGAVTIGPPALGRGLGRPASELVVYYLALVVLALAVAGLWRLRRSSPGRLIVAVRDNEPAAAAFGITPGTVKLLALGISGLVAGAAGVLWADAWRTLDPSQFSPSVSISLLALPVIGGVGSLGGAVAASVVLYGFTLFVSPHLAGVFPAGNAGVASVLLLSGLGLVLVLHRWPRGIAGAVSGWWQRTMERLAERTPPPHQAVDEVLVAEDVSLSFGGVRALDGASLVVRPGEIVGLIGPNGAGKTTLLNVVSGALRQRSGRVVLDGVDVSAMEPELRAALGLSRSFQDARLFPGLTVLETVQVALANRHRAGTVASMAGAPWATTAERASRREADRIVDRLGLTPWRDCLTADLSTGTRRICDLAAQVAAHPNLLLLDEPAAGVAQRDAEALGPQLRRLRDELGCAILVVEHDMPLLMGLCDRIYAMDQGRVIAEGTPDEIRADPRVIASYLGTSRVAVERSGPTSVAEDRAGPAWVAGVTAAPVPEEVP